MSSQQVTHCELCRTYSFSPHEARFMVIHEGRKKAVCPSCKARFCEYCAATLRVYELVHAKTGSALTLCNGCTQMYRSEDPAWQIVKNIHE